MTSPVRLTPIAATGADHDELIAFLTGNAFPFHCDPRPDARRATASIADGVWSRHGTAAFWIDHETAGRVGTLRLDDLGDPIAMLDLRIGEALRGRGLAAPALAAATAHVFDAHPRVLRLEGQTREDNIAMRRAFARCGWLQEAHYRDGWPVADGGLAASVAYAVLRRDVRGPVVDLTGLLVCADDDEARVVRDHLPAHLATTRAERGCLRFEVDAEPDGRTWRVVERFIDRVAFDAHKDRVARSAWGRVTAAIERRYTIRDAQADDPVARAWEAEERLLRPDVRGDPEAAGALLADDFVEIGRSGRRWTRAEILSALADDPDVDDPRIDERTARIVGPGLVLLSYRLTSAARTSRRSALWRCDPRPRCVFHQGTPVA